MGRYMGSTALEFWVYRYIVRSRPELNLFRHPRGWPAIDLPNPDATCETHRIFSTRTYVWIRTIYSNVTQGVIVLTETEVKQVASLLAGDAYLTAPPPLVLPLEPTAKYEPLLEATLNYMIHIRDSQGKSRYEDTMTSFRDELIKVATRLGLSGNSIPSKTSWLGRIMRTLSHDLHSCGIEASFYRKDTARYIVLKWILSPPPVIDGKDDNLTSPPRDAVSRNDLPSRPFGAADGNDGSDGKHQELDWNSLEPKGPSES